MSNYERTISIGKSPSESRIFNCFKMGLKHKRNLTQCLAFRAHALCKRNGWPDSLRWYSIFLFWARYASVEPLSWFKAASIIPLMIYSPFVAFLRSVSSRSLKTSKDRWSALATAISNAVREAKGLAPSSLLSAFSKKTRLNRTSLYLRSALHIFMRSSWLFW